MRKQKMLKIAICVAAYLLFVYVAWSLKLGHPNLDTAKRAFAGYLGTVIVFLGFYFVKGRIPNKRVFVAILVFLILLGFIATAISTGSVFMYLINTGKIAPVP